MPVIYPSQCPHRHTLVRSGIWERGDNEEFGIVVPAAGSSIIKARCRLCGKPSNALPARVLRAWGVTLGSLTWVRQNDPYTYEPCARRGCAVSPTEWHHWAPYNTFSGEADDWPGAFLCREHHFEWHRRMDGYAWHRKGVA